MRISFAIVAVCMGAMCVSHAVPSLARDGESARPSAALPGSLSRKPPGTKTSTVPSPPSRTAAGETTQAATDRCLSVKEIGDSDGDFSRNRLALSSPDLCIRQDVFREGVLTWRLQIVRNRHSPGRYFWFVPHDNENAAFDTAVHGVTAFGGTMVAIETGGRRFNGRQDPNRNFSAGTGRRCALQTGPSSAYTANVLKWRGAGAPTIALHSNERGFNGDGRGGAGAISMLRPLPGNTPYPAPTPLPTRSPSDSMVFMASTGRPPAALIAAMNRAGLNVMLESVSAGRNDCSMSNYAALVGLRPYVNIEVAHGDSAGQRRMLAAALPLLSQSGEDAPIAARAPKKRK